MFINLFFAIILIWCRPTNGFLFKIVFNIYFVSRFIGSIIFMVLLFRHLFALKNI